MVKRKNEKKEGMRKKEKCRIRRLQGGEKKNVRKNLQWVM